MKRWLRMALLGVAAVSALGALVVISGVVPIPASSEHWPITRWFLHYAMQRSVATHSMGIEAPELDERRLVLLGAGHYEGGCRFCHGAPGAIMPVVPRHMTPHPPSLAERVGEYDDAALFYIVLHGIKPTGMPAWPAQSRPDEVWALVAFLRALPELDEQGYRALVFGAPRADQGELAARAPAVVRESCARCHGLDGLGRGAGAFPRLAGQRPRYLQDALIAYARAERHSGVMQPIAAALDAEQRAAAVRFYAELPSPPPLLRKAAASEGGLGEAIALRGITERRVPACAHCHGPGQEPGGTPPHPAYPWLAGQYPQYLALQLRLFAQRDRGGGPFADVMQVVTAHALDARERRAVARFYAAQAAAEAADSQASEGAASSGACDPEASAAQAWRIRVRAPQPGAQVDSPLLVRGEARGGWYFEADFPVALHDAAGRLLGRGIARAMDDWMTEDFVPFEVELEFEAPPTRTGSLVLHRNNPSDLREHDASLCIPVRF